MAKKSGIMRNTFRKGFSVKSWIGLSSLQDGAKVISHSIASMRSVKYKTNYVRPESFQQEAERLGLSESNLDQYEKSRQHLCYYLLLFSLACFIFDVLLFVFGSFFYGIVGISFLSYLLANAYRFDFLALQVRRRTYEIRIGDWLKYRLGKGESQ